MKSLVLVIEHRLCQCGAEYLAPNPRPLARHELENFASANILLPHSSLTPHVHRETLHINIAIEACPRCFHTHNGLQFDLFPPPPTPTYTFTEGRTKPITKKPNPYTLDYF